MNYIFYNTSGKIRFKHWSRKSYAVFNSLGKVIHISVLAFCCSIISEPAFSKEKVNSASKYTYADEDLHEELLDEVVISSSKAPMLQSELMRVIQVINRKDIERSPAGDLAGLLEHIRGVDIRQRGSFGIQADVSIRGGTFDQTMILVNGVNITDPQTGHHSFNLAVSLHDIERIEILQGPGARLFGPNAFNGAINIITRTPEENFMNASICVGQHNYANANLSLGYKSEKTNNYISVSGKRSDGYTDNTDFNRANFYFRNQTETNIGIIDFQSGYNTKAFGANSFYTPRFPNQFEETSTIFTSIALKPEGKVNIKPTIYWRRHSDRFELFRSDPPDWYNTHNYHMTNVAGANISTSIISTLGIFSAGLDYRFEDIYSNVLGYEMLKPRAATGYDNIYYDKYFKRQGVSLMLEKSIFIHSFSAALGTLTYYNKELSDQPAFFPGLDLGWQINSTWRLFSSAGRTLRLPSFTDLFYSSPANKGNPGLKPETAISFEAGIKGRLHNIEIEFNSFKRWGKNMIDWVMHEGDDTWKSMNHTNVDIEGVELYLMQPFQIRNMHSQIEVNYMFLHGDKNSKQLISNYAMDYLQHKLDLKLFFQVSEHCGISVNAGRQSRAGGYMLFDDNIYSQFVEFEPYWLIGGRVYYNINSLAIYISSSNLLNESIVNIANVPQPGRWFGVGIIFNTKAIN